MTLLPNKYFVTFTTLYYTIIKSTFFHFCSFLCYVPGLGDVLGTRPIRFQHWFPGMPFCLFIFFYDELRKYLMRTTSKKIRDKDTKKMNNYPGWIERMTYY